jgi:hypothetical protein
VCRQKSYTSEKFILRRPEGHQANDDDSDPLPNSNRKDRSLIGVLTVVSTAVDLLGRKHDTLGIFKPPVVVGCVGDQRLRYLLPSVAVVETAKPRRREHSRAFGLFLNGSR